MHLTVTRDGATTFDGDPFAGGDCSEGGCSLAPLGGNPLRVVDLDGDGSPEVLLDSFTGGAHCCQLTQILRAGAAGATCARSATGPIPATSSKDLDEDGPPEFVTCGRRVRLPVRRLRLLALPVKILDWRAGTFRNRTRAFPRTVRADLASLRKSLRDLQRRHLPTRGAIAAITADLYSLGRAKDARAYLAGAPGGRAFHARVLKFLHRYGYR